MERANLHQLLDEALDSGRLSSEAAARLLSPPQDSHLGNKIVPRVLLVVGGLIIALGVGRYVGDIWSALGHFGQIALCLTLGAAFLISALWRERNLAPSRLLTGLQVVAHAFLAVGVGIMLTPLNLSGSAGPLLLSTVMALLAGCAYTFSRSNTTIALLITWLSGAWFATADLLLPEQEYVTQAIILVAGISHLLLSSHFRLQQKRVAEFTNLTGTLLTLTPLYAITVFNQVWGMLLIVACFILLFLGAQWRSRVLINLSAFTFTAYLVQQVVELFSDATLALIITGLLILSLGWISWQLQRRLFTEQTPPSS